MLIPLTHRLDSVSGIAHGRAGLDQSDNVEQNGKSEPGVSLGNYATVLFVLGLAIGIAELADASTGAVGRGASVDLEEYWLMNPERFALEPT